MFPTRLPPVMEKLHHTLETYDEYERPVRGFFITELDRNSEGQAERLPVLVYVCPTSLHGPPGPARRPPDWIGEVLPQPDSPSQLERYAQAGVVEYWRLYLTPELRFEQHTDVDRETGSYKTCRVYAADEEVESAVFPGLGLKPGALLEPA